MADTFDIKEKHIHMVGIGGIGMSGIAELLIESGIMITGSDIKDNPLIQRLIKKGAKINIGHKGIINEPDLVVRAFNIRNNNSDIKEAHERNIPIIFRSEFLKRIIDSRKVSISIAGTHGKTTTSAMISFLLEKGGFDPTILVGGEMDFLGSNAKKGRSEIIVSEMDESDGFIRDMAVKYSVITNIEKDHMEYYKTMDNLTDAFNSFIKNTKEDGVLFYNYDDEILRDLSRSYKGEKISFGFSSKADIFAINVKPEDVGMRFSCFFNGQELGKCSLGVLGEHNVYNALASIAVAKKMGMSFSDIAGIIKDFKNVKRRFEVKYSANEVVIVEDYAHHPTEISKIISVAKLLKKNRIIVVFQPHRFSRTMHLEQEFCECFSGVDKLILTDIYAASEDPLDGIGLCNICFGVKEKGIKEAYIVPKADIVMTLFKEINVGDIVLILGAGDVNEIIPELVRKLDQKYELR
ncbi:MAG: UDP-N-acetylmuramate--L-alanine ligase [Candidatus Omnitrophica bacterium]|nr:UDP-N-acetylmuramate--L-alanine ligase [Candidatus Omnitrophota bacterium]